MDDHPNTVLAPHNLPVLTVSELSFALRRCVEQGFERVRVRGEITGFKGAKSGHFYFSLNDQEAVLDAVCWRQTASRIRITPENGVEVIATGRLTTYPGRSKYQIIVDALELAGEGALLKLLEDRRKRLAAEGLFDAARKRPLPFLPTVIGVVTSPTGAVIRDILHRVEDRFPCRVLLWPVPVQGVAAATGIAEAVSAFNDLSMVGTIPRPDVLIVARGGGSLEDLWAFNEEVVVRAVAASEIPIISAVGHETDTTLVDFAADCRAPTPTAAAEMAVPVRLDLVTRVAGLNQRLASAIVRAHQHRVQRLEATVRALPKAGRLIDGMRQRLDDWSDRFSNAVNMGLERRRHDLAEAGRRLASPSGRIEHARVVLASEARALRTAIRHYLRPRETGLRNAASLLESCSVQRVLERGFVLVRDPAGRVLTNVNDAKRSRALVLRFADGEAPATIVNSKSDKEVPPFERQGRLL